MISDIVITIANGCIIGTLVLIIFILIPYLFYIFFKEDRGILLIYVGTTLTIIELGLIFVLWSFITHILHDNIIYVIVQFLYY